jgi:hypothetical protein
MDKVARAAIRSVKAGTPRREPPGSLGEPLLGLAAAAAAAPHYSRSQSLADAEAGIAQAAPAAGDTPTSSGPAPNAVGPRSGRDLWGLVRQRVVSDAGGARGLGLGLLAPEERRRTALDKVLFRLSSKRCLSGDAAAHGKGARPRPVAANRARRDVHASPHLVASPA